MAVRKPVPGMNPNIVEYDENGNIVLTGTDIPADNDAKRSAQGESPAGGDGGGGGGGSD